MLRRLWDRRLACAAAFALCVSALTAPLSACAPIAVTADNPKDGDAITLTAGQPLRVRWTAHSDSAWVWEEKPLKALKYVAGTGRPAADGALELKLFDFEGAAPGEERLTFAYRTALGRKPTEEEMKLITEHLKAFLGVPAGLKPVEEITAWSSVAHAILASNEFVFVD